MTPSTTSGRYVLIFMLDGEESPCASWGTWEEAQLAFPLDVGYVLKDMEAGHAWTHDEKPGMGGPA